MTWRSSILRPLWTGSLRVHESYPPDELRVGAIEQGG